MTCSLTTTVSNDTFFRFSFLFCHVAQKVKSKRNKLQITNSSCREELSKFFRPDEKVTDRGNDVQRFRHIDEVIEIVV